MNAWLPKQTAIIESYLLNVSNKATTPTEAPNGIAAGSTQKFPLWFVKGKNPPFLTVSWKSSGFTIPNKI